MKRGTMAGILIGITPFVLGAIAGLVIGRWISTQHAMAESKVIYHILANQNDRLTPQTREYLKDRLYLNVAHELTPRDVYGWKLDFGPVDEEALNGIDGRKGPISAQETYERSMKKTR